MAQLVSYVVSVSFQQKDMEQNVVSAPHLNDERVVLVEFCKQTIEEIFLREKSFV